MLNIFIKHVRKTNMVFIFSLTYNVIIAFGQMFTTIIMEL